MKRKNIEIMNRFNERAAPLILDAIYSANRLEGGSSEQKLEYAASKVIAALFDIPGVPEHIEVAMVKAAISSTVQTLKLLWGKRWKEMLSPDLEEKLADTKAVADKAIEAVEAKVKSKKNR